MADADDERLAAHEAKKLLDNEQIARLLEEVEGLRAAQQRAAQIEQAKGVLMHSMGIGPDAAFAVLVAASQRENVKLRDVAVRIVAAQDRGADLSTSP
jgi:AmiR/NasT family two-component response regulator